MGYPFTPIQEAWFTALESGEYAQCKEWLCSTNETFCCLGVGADVIIKNDPTMGQWTESKRLVHQGRFYDATLPEAFWKALGLRDDCGKTLSEGESLTNLNDNEGLLFAEIADILRTYPEQYFTNTDDESDA